MAILPSSGLPVRIYTDSPDLAGMRIENIDQLSQATVIKHDIWTDLHDMSRAQYLLGSHSGVSLWAARAIEYGGQGTALLPSKWFKDDSAAEFVPQGLETFSRFENRFE